MPPTNDEPAEREDPPAAVVSQRRSMSTMWIVPLVALIIAGWLGYTTLRDRGPLITISFLTADGLEAGKTRVKYRNVEVGVVETVQISDDLKTILVQARMDKTIEKHLLADSQFWVVRPRLSAGGVSGLGTLISGAFLEFEPGTAGGDVQHHFTGLEDPPVIQSTVAGRRYILTAPSLNSVSQGSGVYFRGISVGEVVGYELQEDRQSVHVYVFVRSPYDELVRDKTRFYNSSGINASLNASGVQITTQSVQALLSGGIAFETPAAAMTADASPADTTFKLYEDFSKVDEARFTIKTRYLLFFEGSVRGLEPGAPVEFRGIRVGTVADVRLEIDASSGAVRLPVEIELEPQRVTVTGNMLGNEQERMARFVAHGLKAQLKTGSLLTGALFVDLDFFPDQPPGSMIMGGKYPALPTVPSLPDEIRQSVTAMVARINKLPLEQLVNDTRATVATVRSLVESPSVRAAVTSLNEVGPLLAHINKAVERATVTLGEAEATLVATKGAVAPNSAVRQQLAELLGELTEASRSLRVLADYLDRHPESLIRGKADTRDR